MYREKGFIKGAVFLAFLCAAPLRAETMPVESLIPAGSDELASLKTLAIGRFTGQDGQAFSIELERNLRQAYVDGAPYFTMVPLRGNSGAEGIVEGSASGRVETKSEQAKRRKCAYKDTKGKCKEWRWVTINCTRRQVTLEYTLTVTGRGRERLYGLSDTAVNSQLICPGGGEVPAVALVVGDLVSGVATRFRYVFAPAEMRQDIRVKEGTGGLKNNAKKLFKDAVRMTKRNVNSACEMWGEVDQLVPDHAPTLFNLGLCAEGRNDFVQAEVLYNRGEELDRSEKYVTEAIERLAQRRRAERQITSRLR